MLPPKNRITRKKDFKTVFESASTVKNSFLVFKFSKNTLGFVRFGFVVSKKVSPRATVRNKIKRRLRAITGKWVPQISKSIDCIIIATPGTATKSFLEFEDVVQKGLKKITL